MSGYYVLDKKASGKYHFVLKAGNHETILSSESYESKGAAENGIESCRTNSGNDARYEKKTARDNSPYFNLKAANGQVIGTSEMYTSTAGRDNGIESCKTNGKGPTKDNT
ncbi:YegP family protein [Salinicola rhizosphaerae]|uniref:DUF1508 domain-containing protein n=1 Tax=Salinicola rhizosphaerae TaxID=1443141 RepID=A0ABQ3EFE3_9GAMM|nr:YegP family protein [Salinicola rhizosphaerae]GHB32926.1 hypothetical protein GCM10009038_34840 [Salinicola rhizosphaerae]